MGNFEELKTLVYNIINAYKLRVMIISALMKKAYKLLRTYWLEIEEMVRKLEDNLAKGQCLRRKDFNVMIGSVIARRQEMEKEVEKALKNFWEEEKQMIKRLKNMVTKADAFGLEEIIKEDILKNQKERERNLAKMLRDLQIEQEELSAALKRLLSKGKAVKVKDFNLMIKALKLQQRQREDKLTKILNEFEMIREKLSAEWQRVIAL